MAQKQQRLWLKTLQYYWKNLHGQRIRFGVMVGFVFMAVIFSDIIAPYFLAEIIDNLSAIEGQPDQAAHVWRLVWLFMAATVLGALLWRIFGYIWIKVVAYLPMQNAKYIFDHMLHRSYNFFTNTFGGSLANQFNQFKWGGNELTAIFLFELFTASVRVVFYAIILSLFIPIIGIGLAIWIVFYVLSVSYLVSKKSPYSRRAVKARSKTTANFADMVTNIFTVKNFARADLERSRFKATVKDEYAANYASWKFGEHIRTYQALVSVVFEIFVIVVAVRLVIAGSVSVSVVILAQLYMARVYRDVFSISRVIQELEKKFNDAHEMVEIFEKPIVVTDPTEPEKPRIRDGAITFKNVTFVYSDGEGTVFKDFNLELEPGQKVGLVGHSGSGKSTLIKLLMRYEDISDGQILIDGQNIARLAQEDLRSHVAVVSQEPVLFHRSIADNIRYGNPSASDDAVIDAATKANAHEFIKGLPKGYDTLVGERGIKLSGGEKQRVAIARAMLSSAPILLLDEATSALDSKSENLIQIALDRLMKNRTTIVIAHRLSTIRMMDRIVVLDQGEIMEDGTHDELLGNNAQYAQLWAHQAGGFLTEE